MFSISSVELDSRVQEKLETKVWDPDNQLKDPQIDQFLVVARLVFPFFLFLTGHFCFFKMLLCSSMI